MRNKEDEEIKPEVRELMDDEIELVPMDEILIEDVVVETAVAEEVGEPLPAPPPVKEKPAARQGSISVKSAFPPC